MANQPITAELSKALDAFQIATRDAAVAAERIGAAVNSRDCQDYCDQADALARARNDSRAKLEEAIARAIREAGRAVERELAETQARRRR